MTTALQLSGVDALGHPRQDYVDRIAALDAVSLFEECKTRIWLAEFSASNETSDHHWQVKACEDECSNRGNLDLFERARKALIKPKE